MPLGEKYFRIKLLQQFLQISDKNKRRLMRELIDNATDDIIAMRRFRMLEQLSRFESQIIKKIYHFETDNVADFDIAILRKQLHAIIDRDG
jgi:hypothetical protein